MVADTGGVTGPTRGSTSGSTRGIARAAIRAELAQVAFDKFWREGFDRVTVNDLAAAAGVSRATFLRYFASKEDAVLCAFDTQGDQMADALRARPASEDDWTALRRALDVLVEYSDRDRAATLAMYRLVKRTPALSAQLLEKQQSWHHGLVQALAERAGSAGPTDLRPRVRVAAAMGCMNAAIDCWNASDGHLDFSTLLDEAFAVLSSGA